MRRSTKYSVCGGILLTLPQLLLAQQPPPPPGPPGPAREAEAEQPGRPDRAHGNRFSGPFRPGRPGGDAPDRHPGFSGREGGRMMGPAGYWLEQVRQRDPQEYERLKRMLEEDPEAFRNMMRNRLMEEKQRRIQGEFPEFQAFLEGLPEDRRSRFIARLGGGENTFGKGPPQANDGSNPDKPENRLIPSDSLDPLVQAWKKAAPEEREKVRNELHKKLGKVLERRLEEREAHLDRMEKDIDKIRAEIAAYRSRQNEIVEERLNSLLSEKSP